MSGLLLVPIHLDALLLETDQMMVEAMADFTRLPYFDGTRDVNPDIAHISEEIVSRPFQNQNLFLKAGVHLHWALPDALTRGSSRTNGTQFPPAPNRWLVIRSRLAQETRMTEKEWIVESDYLYPDGVGDPGSVNIPYLPDLSKGERCPFRYLGRKLPLADWVPNETNAQYVWPLTAVGYGEPSFNAFYPNCHSVFGFYDDDYSGVSPDEMRYDVIGWYSERAPVDSSAGGSATEASDFLTQFVEGFRKGYQSDGQEGPTSRDLIKALETEIGWTVGPEDLTAWYDTAQRDQLTEFISNLKNESLSSDQEMPSGSALLEAVENKFGWTVTAQSNEEFPSQLLCYASLTFAPSPSSLENPVVNDPGTTVAVGNTGTEALSSFLAQTIDEDHKPIIEDQLEALLLSSRLEHRQLDLGPKFQEARHEKGFAAISGGSLWTITQETPDSAAANAADADALQHIDLPDTIASQLNELNLLQQQYDRALQEIQSLRKQLFSDWYKYMLCAYPPEDSRDDYPNIDQVKHYLEARDIALLQSKLDGTGTLILEGDSAGRITGAKTASASAGALASLLAAAINKLVGALDFARNPDLQNVIKFKINDRALSSMQAAGVPDDLLQRLGRLKAEAPKGTDEFHQLLVSTIGEAQTAKFQQLISSSSQAAIYYPKQTVGPRFWQPNEPVVLLSGAAVEPTERHGHDDQLRDDGLLVCQILPNANLKDLISDDLSRIADRIEQIRAGAGAESFAFNTWTRQPWNPFRLEWEVEVFPVNSEGNVDPESEGYKPNFIVSNYKLNENQVDLSFKSGKENIAKAANVYVGSSILTPHAGLKLKGELTKYFIDFIEPHWLEQFYQQQNVAAADQNDTYLEKHFPELFTWYLSRSNVLLQFYKESGWVSDENRNLSWLQQHIGSFISWALARINIKQRFYDEQNIAPENQNDAYLKIHSGQFIVWLNGQIFDLLEFYQDVNVPAEQQGDAYLQEQMEQLVAWYQLQVQDDLQMAVLIQAFLKLADSNCLSQSLGGFNAALLMHKQTMQLAIADPLGFDEYQAFATLVNEAVQNETTSAPEPLNDFNPVRSGAMRINSLRLVDTFGQTKDLDCSRIIATNEMTTPESNFLLTLAPRLVQFARLNLRWLSANQGDLEMNNHPATTPICGWVLTNNLDSSLMIYDNQGKALGSINPLAGDPSDRWQRAPGQAAVEPDNISNPHLKKMVNYLLRQTEDFLSDFISAVDSALENIEPESFAQHQDLALLMGRPLALVRASLDLEIMGAPAIDQSWGAFHQDLERNSRDTDFFTSVQFPVRIGEYRQLNDGVAGYWKEEDEDYKDGIFYAPQSTEIGDDKIKTHADAKSGADSPLLLFISAASPPQMLSMLVDPRGLVHATSGVVPTKAINIPPDQYAAALKSIEITFLSTPIVTDLGKINLPLPSESGYQWSWLEKAGNAWLETATIGKIEPQATFAGPQEIREGWLKLIEAEDT